MEMMMILSLVLDFSERGIIMFFTQHNGLRFVSA